MSEDLIAKAQAVISSHEANVANGDLDAIMCNMAADVVLMAPGSPLVEGAEACRSMYAGLLAMGAWKFGHDYHGAEVRGDAVFLHGIARGTLSLPDGSSEPMVNNFMLALKPDADGKLRVWRVAFSPDAP